MREETAHWTAHAHEWVAWTRTPGHDAFWAYRAALADFVGVGTGEAVEVGCGEGRVCRLLSELGYSTTGVDPVADLLAAAVESDPAGTYLRASADALPLPEHSADLVVSYNMLMDVLDPATALAEMARILRPGGRLVVGIVHPCFEPPATPDTVYLEGGRFDVALERDGLAMHFGGWQRPLSTYVQLMVSAGFVITGMAEPRPDLAEYNPSRGNQQEWLGKPMFAWFDARPAS